MMNLSRFALAMSLFVGAATSNNVPAASDLADEIRAWNDNNVLVSDELSRRLNAPTNDPVTPAPTADPVTASPTGSPTVSPTDAPTGSPTTTAEGSMTAPEGVTDVTKIEVIKPGSFKYTGADCSELDKPGDTTVSDITNGVSSTFKNVACQSPLDSDKCEVPVEVKCTEGGRKLVRSERRLSTDTLEVLFNITVEAYCQTGDCSDVTDIINSIEAAIEANLAASNDSTTGINILAAAGFPSSFLTLPALSSATATAIVLAERLVPMLEDLLRWYPDWHGGTNTCKNDGEYPFYMSRHGSYFRDTLKDCCEYYYGWAYNECLNLGGGNTAELASDEFYADYDSESCVQDCPEDTTGKNCGGLVEGNWVVTYATASACCKGKFWWIDENVCIGESTKNQTAIDTANTGSGKYYVDWEEEKCVKDCADPSDAACGGLAKKWDPLYGTASICCSTRLGYVDRDECTR